VWEDREVPDRRKNRGAHPKDRACFSSAKLPELRAAVDDLCWLLERGYPSKAALALVGNRYSLRDRQRRALQRTAAGALEIARRRAREIDRPALAGATVAVDGYNVLLTLEVALSGGVLLLARDGVLRDLASMSAHYRHVRQTLPAIELLAGFLAAAGVAEVVFYLDRPVSNSGRLKKRIESALAERQPPWRVRLVTHVDRTLAGSSHVVASADSVVLDRCGRWFNLARGVVEESVPATWVVVL
jgi:hypothetical protein